MKLSLALCLAATLLTTSVRAQDTSWVLRIGGHTVNPKGDNGTLAGLRTSIGSDTRPTVSLEYLVTPHWGVDVLGAAPFRHDVRLGGQTLARTRQLPPTVGVNYHFLPQAKVSPFIGAGINYTHFFDTKAVGALQGNRLAIDDSWGAAAHAGVDVQLSPRWLFTADVRWISIGGDVRLNGSRIGKAKVDPWVYGVSVGYRF